MSDLPTKSEIESISLDILKESKSLDIFPTQIDRIVHCANLEVASDVDLSVIDPQFIDKISEDLANSYKDSIGQIRGFIDRHDKKIYLDMKQKKVRQNFVKLHEVGHDVLYWQKPILDHLDNDKTLSSYVEEEFEAEANYFASTTLFQNDRFISKMERFSLGIKASMDLAKIFGSSTHAALRKYVETSKARCALLVLERVSLRGEQPNCYKRDFFMSSEFILVFGNVELPDSFGYKWAFAKDYYFGRKFRDDGEITLSTLNGEADFTYHFFNNKYNAFVFLFPYGENTSSKIRVSIK